MQPNMGENSNILIYQTEDGQTKIETRLENETVWLSQQQMSELFQRERSVVTKHINNAGTISHNKAIEKAHIEYEVYKEQMKNELSKVEEDFIKQIDMTAKALKGK